MIIPLRALYPLLLMAGFAPCAAGAPAITEFMAVNTTSIEDEDGDHSDWLELYNPDSTPIDLGGWFLTDKAGTRASWRLPSVVLGPGEHRVVWASGKDRKDPDGELHTDFKLSGSGEYLALVMPGADRLPADDSTHDIQVSPLGTSSVFRARAWLE